jgi:hypothetical protein
MILTTWRAEKSCPYRDSNSDPSAVQPVVSRYIDCNIPACSRLKMSKIANEIRGQEKGKEKVN